MTTFIKLQSSSSSWTEYGRKRKKRNDNFSVEYPQQQPNNNLFTFLYLPCLGLENQIIIFSQLNSDEKRKTRKKNTKKKIN